MERGKIMLKDLFDAHNLAVNFRMAEVGAVPLGGREEPFHALLKTFPGSRNFAFEVDPKLCAELNAKAAPGQEFHACALGGATGTRTFYDTAHPMCASLYEPDERWPDLFHNLDVMRKARSGTLEVTTLRQFAADQGIDSLDFIKLDIQGAELEVLEGAGELLNSFLCIVCEVEFVPFYKNQPLFSDVDAFLRSRGFMLHKFLGFAGRAMKPIVLGNDLNAKGQVMWSDALFVRDLLAPERLADDQLLKLAVLVECYGSPDVCFHLLAQYDRRRGTDLANKWVKLSKGRA